MQTTQQKQTLDDGGPIPDDAAVPAPTTHRECPIDEFTLSHMRATTVDRDD